MPYFEQRYRGNSYYPYAEPAKQKPAWQRISEDNVLGRLRLKSTFLWNEPEASYAGLRHCFISHPMARGEAAKMNEQMQQRGLATRVVEYESWHVLAVTKADAAAWVKSPAAAPGRGR